MNFVHGRIRAKGGTKVLVSDSGLELPTPETKAADGQSVTYGIRPEHIEIGAGGVPVKVVVTEPTGSETQVFARVGGFLLNAIVKDRVKAKAGDEIEFVIDPSHVHLFDRESEQRL